MFKLIFLFIVSVAYGKPWNRDNCNMVNYSQPLDHFNLKNTNFFNQRVFICHPNVNTKQNVIFFYTGNEADVEEEALAPLGYVADKPVAPVSEAIERWTLRGMMD